MKIGIVSIFDNNNHGNRLQNYALQQVLREYADQVITIKNKPYFSKKSRLARMLPLAESVFFNRVLGMKRRAKIVGFTRRHITTSRGCYWYDKPEETVKPADQCDLYCAGSDQIWNPIIGRRGAFDYLGFAPAEKTFSYAASFGVDEIPQQYHQAVADGLAHVRHISVREDSGLAIVEKLAGRADAQVLVDPTMLLSTEQWDQVAVKPQGLPERYVLTYFLGQISDERRASVCAKAEELDCAIVDLMDKNSPFYEIGPDEFVYMIGHAQMICTDSFHGSVFAFLYGRPLAIFNRQGQVHDIGGRLRTFVSKFSLEACVAQGDLVPDVSCEPDYSVGFQALEAERNKAKAFLGQVLCTAM